LNRKDKYNKKKLFSSEQGAAAPTNPSSIKERLLAWCQQSTKGYAVNSFLSIDLIIFDVLSMLM